MTEPSVRELMEYADGELPPSEEERVLRYLRTHEAAQASVDGIAQLGDFVRAYADAQSPPVDLVDQVMRRIDAPAGSISSLPTKGALSGGKIRRFPAVAATAVGALALAAAVTAVWIGSERVSPPVGAVGPGSPELQPVGSPSVVESVAMAVEGDLGASIESIDLGTSHGSIFLVSAGADVTPVVWLSDDNGADEGRMEPL